MMTQHERALLMATARALKNYLLDNGWDATNTLKLLSEALEPFEAKENKNEDKS